MCDARECATRAPDRARAYLRDAERYEREAEAIAPGRYESRYDPLRPEDRARLAEEPPDEPRGVFGAYFDVHAPDEPPTRHIAGRIESRPWERSTGPLVQYVCRTAPDVVFWAAAPVGGTVYAWRNPERRGRPQDFAAAGFAERFEKSDMARNLRD